MSPSPLSEFDLIRDYFRELTPSREDVALGIGDDCALLLPSPGAQLAATTDTLVAGRHFPPETPPDALGHKALAVNLSDLAAMGAAPAWALLSLTLPAPDPAWLAAFSAGFGELARRHGVQLVGGDTTRGPLSIGVQALGLLPAGEALRRDGARPGDGIFVTGTLGDAGLALRLLQAGEPVPPGLRRRLERPEPRVGAGRALLGVASAAIDISDGLVADLGHLCAASGVGASLSLAALPCSPEVAARVAADGEWALPLAAGDDYELCVTIPEERWAAVAARLPGVLTRVGRIETSTGLRVRDPQGRLLEELPHGYDHFAP